MNGRLIKSLVVAGMVATSGVTAFAASAGNVNTGDSGKGTGGATVSIEAKATEFNMTVPTTFAFVLNGDGTDTVPTNLQIENHSKLSGVYLDSIDFAAGNDNWNLLAESEDLLTQAVDTRAIRLKIGAEGSEKIAQPTNGTKDTTGKVTLGEDLFKVTADKSDSGNVKKLSFKLERGSFNTAVNTANAFQATMNFRWATK